MSALRTLSAADPVVQFSIFTENRVGRLFDLTTLFRDNNTHIIALTVLDTTDTAILRFIVDDPDKARELLINHDFSYVECTALAVEINERLGLREVLAALLEAEINIHYLYSFIKRPEDRSALVLNIEDIDVATQTLNNHGFSVLTQRDISR